MNVLVCVAHPDDEAFGCAATIARHIHLGDRVSAISMTDGVGARGASAKEARERVLSAGMCAQVLGFTWVAQAGFPDNAMDRVPLLDIVKVIEAADPPDIVYTHHHGDLNVDHRIVHGATMTAFRQSQAEIRCFEVPSSTECGFEPFEPNLYIDISGYWKDKMAALDCYGQEMREPPHPRSLINVETLARWRGSVAGLDKAEAFHVARRVIR